jgi:hypothetical protein
MEDDGGGASQTTEPAAGSSTGTDVSLREFFTALRVADMRFDAERDRRLTEVAIEREKALKIKETADLAALSLAREIQTYKDEKANQLREQINSERGLYVTNDKFDTVMKTVNETIVFSRGREKGIGMSANVVAYLITFLIAVVGLLTGVYFSIH